MDSWISAGDSAAVQKNDIIHVQSINEEEYASIFSVYTKYCGSEYFAMLELSKRYAANLQQQEVDMLLIGPGSGSFESTVIQDIFPEEGIKVRKAVAFEPNPAHVILLRETISEWSCETDIREEYFGSESDLGDQKFDVVMFVHSCYCMSESIRIGLMQNALKVLKPHGEIVIYTQCEEDENGKDQMVELVRYFNHRLDFGNDQPYADHEVTAESLKEEFTAAIPQISWSIERAYSNLDISSFFNEDKNDDADAMISFFLSVPCESLPQKLQEDIRSWVQNAADKSEHTLLHQSSILIGKRDHADVVG